MLNIHRNYVDETFDSNGNLTGYTLKYPDTFNFAYDVVDVIAVSEPERKALVWCNPKGEEHILPTET
jgi:acetyl-CoA synthetase